MGRQRQAEAGRGRQRQAEVGRDRPNSNQRHQQDKRHQQNKPVEGKTSWSEPLPLSLGIGSEAVHSARINDIPSDFSFCINLKFAMDIVDSNMHSFRPNLRKGREGKGRGRGRQFDHLMRLMAFSLIIVTPTNIPALLLGYDYETKCTQSHQLIEL